ncbi:MAG: hypothetical protein SWH54_07675 [Thermodesulfobacteriota bacterium]|nr:hypothetical protein [Thermodesulfobacteriota bacterium]
MKKHFVICFIISFSLLFFTGCVTTSTNLEPNYTKESVKAYIDSIDAQFDSPGFKGLHLGMSMDQVNELVLNTPWGYRFKEIGKSPDDPQYKPTNFLKGDNNIIGVTWANIGCQGPEGKGSCHWIRSVYISFCNDKLVEIILGSPKWSADKINTSVKGWGKFALKGLTNKYNQPTKVYDTFSNINIFSFKSGYSVTLYKWNLGPDRIKLGIGEYESKFGCNVSFENVEGINKLKKEQLKGKHEF